MRPDHRRDVGGGELAGRRVELGPAHARPGLLGGDDPRAHVGVVVEPADDDLVAGPPRGGQGAGQLEGQLGRRPAEDDAARVELEQVAHRRAGVRTTASARCSATVTVPRLAIAAVRVSATACATTSGVWVPPGPSKWAAPSSRAGNVGTDGGDVIRHTPDAVRPGAARQPSAARSSAAMSSFCIPIIACIARLARSGSGSESSSGSRVGTTCQERPNRSLSQPHWSLAAAVGGERLPVAVDLGLVGARDLEGDRLGEGELRAAVEGDERLAVQLELHRQRGALRLGLVGAVAGHGVDAGVGEDGHVERGRLLTLSVEPEARESWSCRV